MSSIFGKCNEGKAPVIPGDLELMRKELDHWGAEDARVWTEGAVGLGHLMLYNTPESVNEQLPFHDSLLQLTITADARIDNREEIYGLAGIASPGEKLTPDSTLILRLYKKYGEDCVQYLVGDFAFAVWDEKEQKLFCARDHMGVKPLFYYHDARFFAFASEKKGLLCLPGVDKTIDKQFLYNQVFVPVIQAEDSTLYKYIRRVGPAHTLTFYPVKNELRIKRYWTLDAFTETKFPRKEDYYDGLRHHFEAAVKCRLRTSYPVGSELSGGLDSSAIVGAANSFLKAGHKHIITFSNAFKEENLVTATEWQDELKYVHAVNQFNGIQDYVLVKEDLWDDIQDEIDFSLKANDGLEMWSPTWLMPIKKAAMLKNVRTILSGFPGDEMVSYRGQFYFLDYLDKGQYAKYFSAKGERPFKKFKPFISPGTEFVLHKLKNILMLNSKEMNNIADFFGMPLKSRYAKGDVVWEDINYRERYKSYRHFQKYRLLKPQIGLRMEAETRFGMYFKSEARFPMADIRLTQYYLSMPNHIKYEGDLPRNAYRTAMRKYLPDLVLKRGDKRGNIMPFKSTPQAISNRQEVLMKILDSFENKSIYKNVITIKTPENRYSRQLFLELLTWAKKNFF